jgi:hypothetical protein
MWGLLIGIYLAYVLYPFIYEWQQRRLNKTRLRKMRENFAKGRRWDVAKGGWLSEQSGSVSASSHPFCSITGTAF